MIETENWESGGEIRSTPETGHGQLDHKCQQRASLGNQKQVRAIPPTTLLPFLAAPSGGTGGQAGKSGRALLVLGELAVYITG